MKPAAAFPGPWVERNVGAALRAGCRGGTWFESTAALCDGVEAGYDRRSGVSFRAPWRSQPSHAFTEPGGYTRSQEDTKKIEFEYGRNRADTIGHERTRHSAGSGP